MSEIVHIPFHGDDLLAIERNGKPHIVLKPAFEAIGLDAARQIAKVQKQPWAGTAVTAVPTAGGIQQMVTADVRTFLMALAVIPVSRVAEHVRPKLIAYQSEVADVIEAYWTRGHAVNHRAIDPCEPVTWTWPEVVAQIRQRYGVDMTEDTLRRLLRAAGVLKIGACEPKRPFVHLFWHAGTHWEIHTHAVPMLLRMAEDVGRQLQEYRFLQGRFEFNGLDGNTHPALAS